MRVHPVKVTSIIPRPSILMKKVLDRKQLPSFTFLSLTVMTLSYRRTCHDVVFLREHMGRAMAYPSSPDL